MSAMTVSKSYMVLLGLEGYTRMKKKLAGVGRGVRNVFGGGKETTDGVVKTKTKTKTKVEVEVQVREGKKGK